MDSPARADQLRRQLVDYLLNKGALHSDRLKRAFEEVPREFFLPSDLTLQQVYTDDAIVVKWDEKGQPTSSSSQPLLMADMLETVQLAPGMRVLEIGAGVGYNAAIMAHLLGDGSFLTSLDLDPQMADTARQNLHRLAESLGPAYDRVTVVATDGSLGYLPKAPYDRIIVTVQQWEIAPAWVEQLKIGGLLLLPLTLTPQVWGGLIPAFRKEADGLLRMIGASRGAFMPMRGELAHPTRLNNQEVNRMARLPFDPAQTLPNLDDQGLPSGSFLAGGFLNEELATFLKSLDWTNLATPHETAVLDFDLALDNNPQAAYFGFLLTLFTALSGQFVSLLLVTPLAEPEHPARMGPGWQGNGWHYEPQGWLLVRPVEGGYDFALIEPGPQPSQRTVQGWRPGIPVGEGGPNRALQAIQQVWQVWQRMGRPQPGQYKLLAYPANQPPPVPGYIVPRRFFNLVLPFDPPAQPPPDL